MLRGIHLNAPSIPAHISDISSTGCVPLRKSWIMQVDWRRIRATFPKDMTQQALKDLALSEPLNADTGEHLLKRLTETCSNSHLGTCAAHVHVYSTYPPRSPTPTPPGDTRGGTGRLCRASSVNLVELSLSFECINGTLGLTRH